MSKITAKSTETVRELYRSDLVAGTVLIIALALMSWQGA
tara:strand:+ start:1529 stop:1645 length:117 start_codon:yes stop_codon:yes gene_type:complete